MGLMDTTSCIEKEELKKNLYAVFLDFDENLIF